MSNTWILGVNAYHGDSAACLLHHGNLIAAAEEERFQRIKHWAGFPIESIRYCLQEANIKLSDVNILAINSDPRANLYQKIIFLLKHKPNLQVMMDRMRNQQARFSIQSDLNAAFPDDRFSGHIKRIEHHLAHLASSFYLSPFDEALVASIDGFGDFASCAWGIGVKNHLTAKSRIFYPHSLGAFYQAMTQYLGFPHYGDEYKVMGLAPYGKPNYQEKMRDIVQFDSQGFFKLNMKYFRFHRENIGYTWKDGQPSVQTLYTPLLEKLLGSARQPHEPLTEKHFDIANTTQALFEDCYFALLRSLQKKSQQIHLTISGGCAMNSVANGKIIENTLFQKVYIPPVAGDAGGAIGAALVAWHDSKPHEITRRTLQHPYLGPRFRNSQIEKVIEKNSSILQKCLINHYQNDSDLLTLITSAIIDGKVIGWFQGRMELGARALGNRSILCDPRRRDMKDILNLKIKRRESFRPFAPVILREAVSEWFETDDDVPFMSQVFKIRSEKRILIPAVTHVDGTGRLQTVQREMNPRYYDLIATFAEKTGVPILLNTSFNEQEPIVCRPEEALACFIKTNMDILVMENWVISRKESLS